MVRQHHSAIHRPQSILTSVLLSLVLATTVLPSPSLWYLLPIHPSCLKKDALLCGKCGPLSWTNPWRKKPEVVRIAMHKNTAIGSLRPPLPVSRPFRAPPGHVGHPCLVSSLFVFHHPSFIPHPPPLCWRCFVAVVASLTPPPLLPPHRPHVRLRVLQGVS